jgi:hypothetical protein
VSRLHSAGERVFSTQRASESSPLSNTKNNCDDPTYHAPATPCKGAWQPVPPKSVGKREERRRERRTHLWVLLNKFCFGQRSEERRWDQEDWYVPQHPCHCAFTNALLASRLQRSDAAGTHGASQSRRIHQSGSERGVSRVGSGAWGLAVRVHRMTGLSQMGGGLCNTNTLCRVSSIVWLSTYISSNVWLSTYREVHTSRTRTKG